MSYILGDSKRALDMSGRAEELAHRCSHPLSVVLALTLRAHLHQLRREAETAQAFAEKALKFAEKQGFLHFTALATFASGWALAEKGLILDGITRMNDGLKAYQKTGAGLRLPWLHTELAQAYAKAGKPEEALSRISEAQRLTKKAGERLYESETLRVRGMLHSMRHTEDAFAKAESCYLQALNIAKRQEAKIWELRTAIELAKLWCSHGQQQKSRPLLAPIYE